MKSIRKPQNSRFVHASGLAIMFAVIGCGSQGAGANDLNGNEPPLTIERNLGPIPESV